MTEKLTSITLPGAPHGSGFMEWGECTAEEMIARLRRNAAHMREQAELIEGAADEHFQIEVVRGVHVSRHVRTVQQSSLTPSAAIAGGIA